MCYSAKVEQNIRDLARHFAATLDYSEVERLMMERLAGRPIRLARGFEWNFSNPQSAQERRIQQLDAEYRSKKTTDNEQEVFKQKKRLAAAAKALTDLANATGKAVKAKRKKAVRGLNRLLKVI